MKFPDPEESRLIREYILLPFLLHVFERDKKIIATSAIKTRQPYIDAIERAIDQAHRDLVRVRKKLRAHGIRFYEEQHHALGVDYKYVYKGYHLTAGFHWEYMKGQIELRMRYYLGEKIDLRKYQQLHE
ncbi:MAG: hypothetical protein H0Z33_13525 [Bacillaceae bacterium]|nr:hypothetical protein [Bacillaceae bacterium]